MGGQEVHALSHDDEVELQLHFISHRAAAAFLHMAESHITETSIQTHTTQPPWLAALHTRPTLLSTPSSHTLHACHLHEWARGLRRSLIVTGDKDMRAKTILGIVARHNPLLAGEIVGMWFEYRMGGLVVECSSPRTAEAVCLRLRPAFQGMGGAVRVGFYFDG